MMCDNCHQRPAKYHVTRIVDEQRTEENLCEECAVQRGELPFALQPAPTIHHFLAGLLQGVVAAPEPAVGPRCPDCGLTQEEFARTGMLGCATCYRTFGETLRPLLRRVNHSGRHGGKLPRRGAGDLNRKREIGRLRRELEAAVQRQEFEQAAELRDRIRSLQEAAGT